MHKNRLEAFSDGVLAIIITIMVLELKVPHGAEFSDLQALVPIFLSYVLSFIFVGIYWNNHHHMFQAVQKVSGTVLWANMNLLFWLSLIPFATAWMGENHFAQGPVALYGFVLLACGAAYTILCRVLIALNGGKDSTLWRAVQGDIKGKLSVGGYVAGIVASYFRPEISLVIYVAVAGMWLVPDRRIERTIA